MVNVETKRITRTAELYGTGSRAFSEQNRHGSTELRNGHGGGAVSTIESHAPNTTDHRGDQFRSW